MTSSLDNSIAYGRVGVVKSNNRELEAKRLKSFSWKLKKQRKMKRKLENEEENVDRTEASKMQFTAEITGHTSRDIKLQINFDNPG